MSLVGVAPSPSPPATAASSIVKSSTTARSRRSTIQQQTIHPYSDPHDDGDDDNPADWCDSDGEDGIDFRERIVHLTRHTHSREEEEDGMIGFEEDEMNGFEIGFEEIENGIGDDVDTSVGVGVVSSSSTGGWCPRGVRDLSLWDSPTPATNIETGTWRTQPTNSQENAAADSRDRRHAASASFVSTASCSSSPSSFGIHSNLSSRFSTLSSQHEANVLSSPTPTNTATLTTIPASTPGGSGGGGSASPPAAAAAATGHKKHPSHTAGIGRNLSLDSSARALGLNIVYVERLALPMLRSEIHSFFSKLDTRSIRILNELQHSPEVILTTMLQGMITNGSGTSDEELKKSFEVSAKRMEQQIQEVRLANPNRNDNTATATLPSPETSPSPDTHAQSSSSPPQTPLGASPPTQNSFLSSSPSPGLGSPNPASTSSAPASFNAHFVPPDWWPASLVSSYSNLVKVHDLFHTLKAGFDDAGSTTGFSTLGGAGGVGPSGSPPRRRASSGSTIQTHSSPLPPRSIRPQPLPKLQALPTTHSNREGLAMMAQILQSFSLLVAFEGGQITQASKLALAFQRMANTLLEKHQLEETQWIK